MISLPEISKWNTKNLEELFSILEFCPLSLNFPDLTGWNNYDEDIINAIPDNNMINEAMYFEFDISFEHSSPEERNKFLDNFELLEKKILDKFLKSHDLDT